MTRPDTHVLAHGVGRQLLCAAIDRFREIAGSRLYLESNSRLATALALYESAGFAYCQLCPDEQSESGIYIESLNILFYGILCFVIFFSSQTNFFKR